MGIDLSWSLEITVQLLVIILWVPQQTWKNAQTCKPCLCKCFQICVNFLFSCPPVRLSFCPPVLLSSCYHVVMFFFPTALLFLCTSFLLPCCHPVRLLSFCLLSSCPYFAVVLLSSCPPIIMLSCPPVLLSSCLPVLLPY